MSLIIKKQGILTTVQDLGRTHARRFGVNPSGVMDTVAARLINIALGNDENAAVLEMHFPAGEFEFADGTVFALAGADFAAEMDGRSITNWSTAFASRGSTLRFTKRLQGSRAYLAVRGGFDVEDWLGSKSTNLAAGVGGYAGRALRTDDQIECAISNDFKHLAIGRSLIPKYSRFPTVRIIAGPEFDQLTAISERAFLNEQFTVTNDSNRMGYRLHGTPLHRMEATELVSSAVTFGTIQLLPDGQMIVLMADHQTSGGYPRIANVIAHDLPLLAQLGPNNKFAFHLTTIEDAEAVMMKFERDLSYFRLGCRLSAGDGK